MGTSLRKRTAKEQVKRRLKAKDWAGMMMMMVERQGVWFQEVCDGSISAVEAK